MHKTPNTEIDQYLSHFQGNAEEAISAIRNRVAAIQAIAANSTSSGPQLTEEVISVESISKSYKSGRKSVTVLRDISLTIRKGEFIALTGPSGSGKSTLLQLIGCLDQPTSGRVFIGGKDVTKLKDGDLSDLRSSSIGFIFQSFYLQPFLRLKDNLSVPAMFTTAKRREIEARGAVLLDQVGLNERSTHFPNELSGGQVQRAAIARALMNNPKIILADEPTGNLDSRNSRAIIDLFKLIRQNFGTTIIVVTHSSEIAAQADRVITLSDGVIV